MPNGVAYADGTLKIGDILMKIDGETVASGKHKKDSLLIIINISKCEIYLRQKIKLVTFYFSKTTGSFAESLDQKNKTCLLFLKMFKV